MHLITRIEVHGRAALHRGVARLPAWLRRGLRQLDGPARLDLRLDDLDRVRTAEARREGETGSRPLEEWRQRVVDWFIAHGPVPVVVISRPENPMLMEIVRFCHRLDVPVSVRTVGAALGKLQAEAIIDGGARRVVVTAPTVDAILCLVEARTSRSARVDLEAEVQADATLEEARALVTAGADGVRVAAGWQGAVPGPWPLRPLIASFSRTAPGVWTALDEMAREGTVPGRERKHGHCGIGMRVVLDAAGASSCPFKSGQVDRDAGWAGLAAHRAQIAACTRECWHPEVL